MGQEQFSRLALQGPENPEKPTCKNRRENEPLVGNIAILCPWWHQGRFGAEVNPDQTIAEVDLDQIGAEVNLD